jgi:hypothetical protein
LSIIIALLRISPEVTAKGFKKCHISNAMGKTDYILRIDSEEGGEVKNECEEDAGTDSE